MTEVLRDVLTDLAVQSNHPDNGCPSAMLSKIGCLVLAATQYNVALSVLYEGSF